MIWHFPHLTVKSIENNNVAKMEGWTEQWEKMPRESIISEDEEQSPHSGDCSSGQTSLASEHISYMTNNFSASPCLSFLISKIG